LLLYRSFDADVILKFLHWLRVTERIEYKISALSSLPGPPDPHRWSLSFARSFSLVSKSPIALSATQHPISGTDFLHHLDYHVPPLHPPIVLHFLDLLLACLIWCSTLVSKLTFSPGPFLHSFSHYSPRARLRGYLTIAGVDTSLMKFSLGSVRQIKLAYFASFKAHYNIVLFTHLRSKSSQIPINRISV